MVHPYYLVLCLSEAVKCTDAATRPWALLPGLVPVSSTTSFIHHLLYVLRLLALSSQDSMLLYQPLNLFLASFFCEAKNKRVEGVAVSTCVCEGR